MFKILAQFNKTVWLIIVSTLLTRFVFFMVWPYLALILRQKFGLNTFEVGVFLASAMAAGVVIGFISGNISDRIGRRKVILFGLAATIIGVMIMGWASGLGWMFVGTLVQASVRGVVETPSKALMTDMLENRAAKDMALQVRYFVLNISSAFGPLAGIALGLTGQQSTFYLVGVIYGVNLLAAALVFRSEKQPKLLVEKIDRSFGRLFSLIRADHAFALFVLSMLLTFVAFVQIEAGLIQYLQIAEFDDAVALFAKLILINGCTVLILQAPVQMAMARMSVFWRSNCGVVLFVIAFVLFAVAPAANPTGIMVAMFVLSVGEVILFPTISIKIDRMAPKHLKGSYFGIAGVAEFGFAGAPLLGGYLLYQFGGVTMWLTMAALSCCVGGLLFLAQVAKRPDFGS